MAARRSVVALIPQPYLIGEALLGALLGVGFLFAAWFLARVDTSAPGLPIVLTVSCVGAAVGILWGGSVLMWLIEFFGGGS